MSTIDDIRRLKFKTLGLYFQGLDAMQCLNAADQGLWCKYAGQRFLDYG